MLEFIQYLATEAPYTIVFGALLLAGLGVPLPEDIPLLVGGYLCGTAAANGESGPVLWIMLSGSVACILLGDLFVFWLGRRYGAKIHAHPRILRLIGKDNLDRTFALVSRKGAWFVVMARFLPGFRTPSFFAAGALHMRPATFLAADGAASLASAPLFVLLGYFFHDNFTWIVSQVKKGEWIVAALILAGLVVAIVLVKRTVTRRINALASEIQSETPAPGAEPVCQVDLSQETLRETVRDAIQDAIHPHGTPPPPARGPGPTEPPAAP